MFREIVGTSFFPYHLLPIEMISTQWELTCVIRLGSVVSGQWMLSRLESILCSNNYYSILEFFHAIAIIPMQVLVLLLCSNYAHFIIERKHPSHWHLSFLALHSHCSDSQNFTVLICMLACFSEFSQLNPPNLHAATWRFAHAPCYYSGIMLKCFWIAIIPILCSA